MLFDTGFGTKEEEEEVSLRIEKVIKTSPYQSLIQLQFCRRSVLLIKELGVQIAGKNWMGFTIDTDFFFNNFFDSDGDLFFFFFLYQNPVVFDKEMYVLYIFCLIVGCGCGVFPVLGSVPYPKTVYIIQERLDRGLSGNTESSLLYFW